MKNQAESMSSGQFYDFVLTSYPKMDVGDKRPYKTIISYLNRRGYLIQTGSTGNIELFRKHQGPQEGRQMTLPGLLDTVARWARAAERDAQTNYQRLCAEEDQEEMALLKEQWKQCRCLVAKDKTPPNVVAFPRTQGTNEFDAFADKVTGLYEEDARADLDLSTLFASF